MSESSEFTSLKRMVCVQVVKANDLNQINNIKLDLYHSANLYPQNINLHHKEVLFNYTSVSTATI